jgi:hypothetical protein
VTYSSDIDFKIGDIPLPSYIDKAQLIQDAADEIDSYIGFVYKTPVNIEENGGVSRPARLLLKRISSSLATGRLILALAASGEQTQLHAYGVSLVNDALAALQAIASREILLEGAEPASSSPSETHRGPLIANVDPRSQVEAFYDNFHAGARPFPVTTRRFDVS